MRTVADARVWAARQWRSHWPSWLAGAPAPSWPLHPPTERDVLAAPDDVANAVGQWRAASDEPGVSVDWVERSWPAFGRNRLPSRVTLSPDAAARWAGEAASWERASAVAEQTRLGWPDADVSEGLFRAAKPLGRLADDDVPKLLAVVGWLVSHPASELWERELPVVGVDTKWFERHRRAVEPLVEAITGAGSGLRRHGVRFAVRLPPEVAGARDFAADLTTLRQFELRPERVLIVENLTTLLSLPDLPQTAAVHGMGFAAPSLSEVTWLAYAEQWYWGDLDTYGFQILGQMRQALPDLRSVLMDQETWADNAEFAVPEPRPYLGEIGHLSASERRGLARIREGSWRLEQERIPRAYAQEVLERSIIGTVPRNSVPE